MAHDLDLQDSVGKAKVMLDGADIKGDLLAGGARLPAGISANRIAIGGGALFGSTFAYTTVIGAIDLSGAVVSGPVILDGASIMGTLGLNGAQIDGFLAVRREYFVGTLREKSPSLKDINLVAAHIRGDVEIYSASVDGSFDARQMVVSQAVRLDHIHLSHGLLLESAHVGGDLDIRAPRSEGTIDASGIHVNSYILLGVSDGEGGNLTDVSFLGANVKGGVGVVSTNVSGTLNFMLAKIGGTLTFGNSDVGAMNLLSTEVSGLVVASNSEFRGPVQAEQFHAKQNLVFKDSRFLGEANLKGAEIDGTAVFLGTALEGVLECQGVRIGGNFALVEDQSRRGTFKSISLINTRIANQLLIQGINVDGSLDANGVSIGSALLLHTDGMNNKPTFLGDVDFSFARIDGFVETQSAVFARNVYFYGADIKRNLMMFSRTRIDGDISLENATVEGTIQLDDIVSNSDFNASWLHVGTDLNMSGMFDGPITLHELRVAGSVDVTRATLGDTDLSDAVIGANLVLGTSTGATATWRRHDGGPATLSLLNTHVGNLVDNRTAWPRRGHLHLADFSFSRLGGGSGDSEEIMRERGMQWWDHDWAELDPIYSPTPYSQLAAAFASAGDRGAAEEIRYRGRERERRSAWPKHKPLSLILLLFGQCVGYGIGSYALNALRTLLEISLIGALVLRYSVPHVRSQGHSAIWCWLASISRLVPGTELNHYYQHLFDHSNHHLKEWQFAVFTVLAVSSWILVAVSIAVLAGIAQL